MKKQDEGFTLIELLIVIVILGILATIVVFAVAGIRDQGDQSACETELRSMLTANEAYYAETGGYPAAGAAGDALLLASYFRDDIEYWSTDGAGSVTAVQAPAQVVGGDANCNG